MEERKGFLTPNQEKGVDGLIELSGIAEKLDGMAIKLADNKGLEKLKGRIPSEHLPSVYEVVDGVLAALGIEK